MGLETIDRYRCSKYMCKVLEEVPAGTKPILNWRHVTLDAKLSTALAFPNSAGMKPDPNEFYFCPVCVRDTFGDFYVTEEDVKAVFDQKDLRQPKGAE